MVLNQSYLGTYDFLMITIDSTSWCSAEKVKDELYNIKKLDPKGFRKVYSNATYTFPSHCSMFMGVLPDNRQSDEIYYNRTKLAPFLSVSGGIHCPWPVGIKFHNNNIIKGFESSGYRTICIGGVGWFNTTVPTTSIWKREFFQEVHWNSSFSENSKISLEGQTALLQQLLVDESKPVFAFVNVSATHVPYQGQNQKFALKKFDTFLPEFLKPFKQRGRPLFLIIVSDHGDTFNPDWRKLYHAKHTFYLPNNDGHTIMEIPLLVVDMPNGVD